MAKNIGNRWSMVHDGIMEAGFEILEHTADIGLRALGRDPARLFETAAAGMFEIAYDAATVAERDEKRVHAEANDIENLLVNFLDELLWLIDGEVWLPRRVVVDKVAGNAVAGTVFGEPRDAARHAMRTIIKAVTFHLLAVRQVPGGWQAEVYFDI